MKRIADQTLYEILDVRDDATADEIARACDRARALYGPGSLATYTLMSPEEAALLGSRIEEARATLLDPGARARYDEALHPRAGEARAAIGASTPGAPFPPVIPAAPPPPPEPPRPPDEPPVLAPPPRSTGAGAEAEEQEPEPMEPVRLVVPAAEPEPEPEPEPAAARAPAPPPRPPAPVPIRLEREVAAKPPPAAAPAKTPIPAAPPPPPPPAPLPAVPEGAPWTGDILRQIREARGISVQQIAERTKVTRHHIENIEAERFGQLPAPVYLRGILLALARELRLDGQKVARSFLERVAAAKGK